MKYDVAFVSSGSEQRHIFVADVLYAISRYIVPPYIGGQLSLSTKCYQTNIMAIFKPISFTEGVWVQHILRIMVLFHGIMVFVRV